MPARVREFRDRSSNVSADPPGPRRCAALAVAALMLGAAGWRAGRAQGVVGTWRLADELRHPAGASEQCAIIQNVSAEDQPNVGLSVIVLKTADQQARLLRVLAPLGVLLPSGLGLKVDQVDVGRTASSAARRTVASPRC
jgi:invasion protein IalB